MNGRISAIVLVILVLAASAAGCVRKDGAITSPTPQPGVPSEYAALYSSLAADLDRYDAFLAAHDPGTRYPVTFAAELLTANANRGPDLLKPGAIKGVELQLDRLQEMGVQGVTIAVSYPLYTPDFPRYGEYVKFYKQVASEVKKRNMTLDVETGFLFSGTTFSDVDVSYKGLTFDQYKANKKRMVQAIITDLQPDYINLGSEPDTEYGLTGIKEFNRPEKNIEYVNYVLDGLDRGDTKVGAGIGTWGNIEYVKGLASGTSLDAIAIHVYPVNGDYLQKIRDVAAIARQNNKRLILDEAWLYKTERPAGNVAASSGIFRRDAYSFWAPLDQRFMSTIAKAARQENIEYVSFFWSTYFFAYLDYGPDTAGLDYDRMVAAVNKEAADNMIAGRFTSTGGHFGRLIKQGDG